MTELAERCCQLGEHHQLAGIITEPVRPWRRFGCVLVNAGVVAKSGPYRLYVELARRLARDGITTLRFDLGGLGDSRQELTSLPLHARTRVELRAAIDELMARHPCDGVVLGGLCSGAEDSFRYAEHDPRVVGTVLIDPFSYRTAGWTWRNVVYRTTRRALRAAGIYQPIATSATAGGRKLVDYKYMDRVESSRVLRTMIDRRAFVHFVYTGGQQDTFNHAGQLADMFEDVDFAGRVSVDYVPHIDHTQLLAEDRRTLVDAIARRLTAG